MVVVVPRRGVYEMEAATTASEGERRRRRGQGRRTARGEMYGASGETLQGGEGGGRVTEQGGLRFRSGARAREEAGPGGAW